jgi:alpha-ketoglutarate-dependent taurine dioxygenase
MGGLPVVAERAPATVAADLVRHGALVVRSAGAATEDFVALGDALMVPVRHGAAGNERELVCGDPTTTTVTAGVLGMPLHREAGYTPASPSLLMFHCVRPAAEGGETLLCDGAQLLRELPRATRDFVEDRALCWETDLSRPQWESMWATTAPDEASRAAADWASRLLPWESLTTAFHGETMTLTFVTTCTPPALFDGAPAFCNSLLLLAEQPGCFVERDLRARLDDGSPFPADVLDEISRVAHGLTEAVSWRAGDTVVVNNTRYLHGRRSFADRERRILVRMGYLRDEWLPDEA